MFGHYGGALDKFLLVGFEFLIRRIKLHKCILRCVLEQVSKF